MTKTRLGNQKIYICTIFIWNFQNVIHIFGCNGKEDIQILKILHDFVGILPKIYDSFRHKKLKFQIFYIFLHFRIFLFFSQTKSKLVNSKN